MHSDDSRLRFLMDLALVVVIGAILGGPLIGFVSGMQPELVENRELAPRPQIEFTLPSLSRYPREFDLHFNDTFGFRDILIRWNTTIHLSWLAAVPPTLRGDSEAGPLGRRAIYGKDGWFYYFGPGMMDDFRGVVPFRGEQLAAWRRRLEERRHRLAARGIDYLFILVPEKQTIYPEFLPSTIRRVQPHTRADELAAHLRATPTLPFLDLREILAARKPRLRLYHRTGTHWNAVGAYFAYHAIAESLARLYPELRPLPLDAFALRREVTNGRPFVAGYGIADLAREEVLELEPLRPRRARIVDPEGGWVATPFRVGRTVMAETGDPTLPRAVMFHDSFLPVDLEPYLSEHFERIVYHWRPKSLDWALIARERPDLVIEEKAERFLLDRNDPEIRDAGKERRSRSR
jgi:hypothetical protein